MLTTIDNPYDPFEDFLRWFEYDEQHGYFSCERIARFAKVNDGMSNEEQTDIIEGAIDKIIELDFTGLFRKVDEKRAKELVDIRLTTPNYISDLESGVIPEV